MHAVKLAGVVLVLLLRLSPVAVQNVRAAEDSPAGVQAEPGGAGVPEWRDPETVRSEIESELASGLGIWWLLLLFAAICGLMLWLAWQNRHGIMIGKSAGENIDIVARRMFGPKHGVICVRLRDREFLLGIGGDGITLLSEWRSRPTRKDDVDSETFNASLEKSGQIDPRPQG